MGTSVSRETIPDRRQSLDLSALFSLVFGMALTLIVSGYQFGRGNHTVYLLDGLRALHPELLTRDWFVTQTLQYHAVFSLLTATLMKLHILQPAFLLGYLALIVLWHIAWRGIVHAVGADDRTYLLSVVFYYLSAAGISIGVFQFLQDACFLPSNVSNIAMLWGLYCWMRDRRVAAGFWLGVAGLFHVNFAAMAIGMWTVLVGWQWLGGRRDLLRDRALWWGTIALFVPSLFNLAMTVPDELRHGGTMPMSEFVRVYVRFRHAHHYDPIHWPLALWASFLWPIPLAVLFVARHGRSSDHAAPLREALRIFIIISGLLLIAFLFAGVWFINEPLVQLCLWRFSIFIKMFSCIGAGWLLVDRLGNIGLSWMYGIVALVSVALLGIFVTQHDHLSGMVARTAWEHHAALAMIVAALIIAAVDRLVCGRHDAQRTFRWLAVMALPVLVAAQWNRLGVGMTPEPETRNYREVCAWAKANTPVDAIFLVPPQETDFRLYAERAIVVNYKHVPQLSGEIIQWRRRLLDVLGLRDVRQLPFDYTRTMNALGATYESRPAADLLDVATRYDARFIVVDHPLDTTAAKLVFSVGGGGERYFVYDRDPAAANP